MKTCKGVGSPGSNDEPEDAPDDNVNGDVDYLSGKDITKFRRAAARLNYMALDRPDISSASKVLARGMSKPSSADVIRLKRILRYLKSTPNMFIC